MARPLQGSMKAILHHTYGSPDVLRYEDTDKPVATDSEVVLRVHAASVNPLDWHFMRGEPYALRLVTGLPEPKDARLGVDVAGVVDSVGRNVTRFQMGDEVFGAARGAFAEYACAPESSLAVKPPNFTFEQAAAVPIAGVSALQGLRDAGHIQPGNRVLINGASGGVGTFAVQIAKSFGADITGVCSTRNVDMVHTLGAYRVIDYTREDFTRGAARYDVILDCVGNHSLSSIRRVVAPKGRYVPVGAEGSRWMLGAFARSFTAMALSQLGSRKMVPFFLAKMNQEALTTLGKLIASGKVVPVIDRSYSLIETPDAIGYLEKGRARGKVVITMG